MGEQAVAQHSSGYSSSAAGPSFDRFLMIARVNASGEILSANDLFCETSRYCPDELVGSGIEMLLTDDASQGSAWVGMRNEALTAGYWRGDVRLRRKDGSDFWVEIFVEPCSSAPYGDEFIIVQRDITERKQMELALKAGEERLRQITENIREVFWLMEWETQRVIYVSPSFESVWGVSCTSLYANPGKCFDMMHPDDRDRVKQGFMNAVETGKFDEEYRVQRPDGEIRWIRDRGFPVYDNGSLKRMAGIAEDITRFKQIQEELRGHIRRKELAQQALKDAHDKLERRVEERTRELRELNEQLREEVHNRKRSEKALRKSESELLTQKKELEQKNIALREVLAQIEIEKRSVKDKIQANIENLLLPILERMELNGGNGIYAGQIREIVADIASSFGLRMEHELKTLSPRELEISNLIRNGHSNKDIARFLNVSVHTVEKHRRNMRKKLGITNARVNLSSHLRSL